MQPRNAFRHIVTLFLALTLLAAPLWAQSQPQLPDPGRTSLSREQQEQVGLQAVGEVYRQMPVLPDSHPVSQYVQQLGRKLQGVIPAEHTWPYQFHVIPQKEINAFALPGGPIFVNIGTIQAAENEAQLAGVLAHEMSHVYMQHSAKQMAKAQWTGLFAGLAGAVLPQSGLGSLARMGIQFGAGSVLMKYSRTDEAQADQVGAIVMYRAGYNPKAMADFFVTLEKKYGRGGPQFLSDHPNPGNRELAIEKEIQPWPQKQYLPSSSAFAQARQNAGSVRAYSSQEIAQGAKQGVWAQQNRKSGATPPNLSGGNGQVADVSMRQVQPSGTFARATFSGLSIGYPQNWKTAGNSSSFVIAPQEGVLQSGIAYGVLINAAPNARGSLDQATEQILASIEKDNPGTRTSGEIKTIDVDGVEGRSVLLSGTSPLQQGGQALPERDWVVTFEHPRGGLIYMVFVSPERDFSQLRATYQRMLDSVMLQ
ncbi:MAG TPA: M48 family metalloprotease [Candidatus Angelobacter sp.]|nr:M48 family metalloprotease [Candidatus Angelobacter sp.]